MGMNGPTPNPTAIEEDDASGDLLFREGIPIEIFLF